MSKLRQNQLHSSAWIVSMESLKWFIKSDICHRSVAYIIIEHVRNSMKAWYTTFFKGYLEKNRIYLINAVHMGFFQ